MNEKILCPKCSWKPDGGKHWQCSCLHVWNTFETAGNCPKCSKTWEDTQCPGPGYPGGCGKWSPHLDWYVELENKVQEEYENALKNDVKIKHN